ncbi:MAG: hypothetical protein N2688_03575 [Burkholderiaceae bacterium]|nr:hypothetical protein [Burkholderiaceae bacterium]
MLLVNHPPPGAAVAPGFVHAPWHGWTLADTIFPGFLFAVGIAVHLSLSRLGPQRRAWAVRRVLVRFALLMALNFLLVNFPYYEAHKLLFSGTLALIAWCYALAALLYLFTGWRVQLAVAAASLALQSALLALLPVPGHGAGVLTPEGNAARFVDQWLLGWMGPRPWPEVDLVVLPTVGSLSTTLLGVVAGQWLFGSHDRAWVLRGSLGAGVVAVLAGLLWSQVLPINKPLWTGSYVLLMAGISLLALTAFRWVIEVRGWEHWAEPLRIAGVNALFLYVFAQALQRLLVYGRVHTDGGSQRLRQFVYERFFLAQFPPEVAVVLYATAFLGLCFGAAWILYRYRLFLKI